jgi:hypothetical protein
MSTIPLTRRDALALVDSLLASTLPSADPDAPYSVSSAPASIDVAAFVSAATEALPLESLRLAAGARLADAKGELVAAINRDYASFVSLSTSLEGTDTAILRLRAPVAEAANSLRAVLSGLEERAGAGEACRRAGDAARDMAAAAEELLDARDALGRANDLLERAQRAGAAVGSRGGAQGEAGEEEEDEDGEGDADDGGDAGASNLVRKARLLLRAAVLLRGCAARAEAAAASSTSSSSSASSTPLPATHVAAVAREARAAVATFLGLLRETTVLSTRAVVASAPPSTPDASVSPLHLCLLAGSAVGGEGVAAVSESVAAAYTQPLLDTFLTPTRFHDGSRGSFRGVQKAFDALAVALGLGNSATPLVGGGDAGNEAPSAGGGLRALLAASAGVPGLDLLSSAVWAPVVARITAGGAAAASSSSPSPAPFLSPAIPQVFHANYTVTSAFFRRLREAGADVALVAADPATDAGLVLARLTGSALTSSSSPSSSLPAPTVPATAAESLAAHAATKALAAAWRPKFAVYAQLRGAELSQRVEQALRAKVQPPPPQPQPSSGAAAGGAIVALSLHDVTGLQDAAPLLAVLREHFPEGTAGPRFLLGADVSPPSSFSFRLPATAGVWSALAALWAPTSFLPPLLPATLAQGIALLNRYGAWVGAGAALLARKHGADGIVSALATAAGAGAAKGAAAGQLLGDTGFLRLPVLPPVFTRLLSGAAIHAAVAGSAAVVSAPTPAGAGGAFPPLPPTGAGSAHAMAHPDLLAWLDVVGVASGGSSSPLVAPPQTSAAPSILQSGGGAAGAETILAAARDALVLADAATLLLCSKALGASSGRTGGGGDGGGGGGSDPAGQRALVAAVARAAAGLRALAPYAAAAAQACLLKQCTSVCGAIRTVPSALRIGGAGGGGAGGGGGGGGAARPLPRSPSPYVASLLRPLRTAVAAVLPVDAGAATPSPGVDAPRHPFEALVALVCAGVIVGVLGEAAAVVAAVKEDVERTDASLQWLKQSGGAGGGAAGGPITDADRITLQLALDVKAVGREVGEGGGGGEGGTAAAAQPLGAVLGLRWTEGAGGGALGIAGVGLPGEAADGVVAAFRRVAALVGGAN